MKVSILLGTYNEAARLPNFLDHASKWADEIVVCDKSSTDATVAIARAHGARVIIMPFSRGGWEDIVSMVQQPSHDWVFLMTPGEVPTRELIDIIKAEPGDDCDLIYIPKKLYVFGIHDDRSPWGKQHQAVLANRTRAGIRNVVHKNFTVKPGGKAKGIAYSETCHVYHPTHATVAGMLRAHGDYALAAAQSATPSDLLAEADRMIQACDFGNAPELQMQRLAWVTYWLTNALAALEKQTGRDVPAEYAAETSRRLVEWRANLVEVKPI